MSEGEALINAFRDSSKKLIVFFSLVVLVVISLGALMYIVESDEEGTAFYNIPVSIYWAVVTMTTVGYGDIAPITTMGRIISTFVMLLGYIVIAVPTGVVSSSMLEGYEKSKAKTCKNCGEKTNRSDSLFCKHCGKRL